MSNLPYGFGADYLDSKHHSNVKVVLKSGDTVGASSIVLAINSPVLKKLIEDKGLTKIELEDFEETVCRKFLESMYSGSPMEIHEDNFRHTSRLGYKLQVEWIKEKCSVYFRSLMTGSEDRFDFLMKEGIAAKSFDKCGEYLDALAEHKTNQASREDIEMVEEKMGQLETLPLDELDFFIRLANKFSRNMGQIRNTRRNQYHNSAFTKEYATVIVEQAQKYFENQDDQSKLDEKTKYILTHLDFKSISSKYKGNGKDLFVTAASSLLQSLLSLEELSNKDMKMILKLYMGLGK